MRNISEDRGRMVMEGREALIKNISAFFRLLARKLGVKTKEKPYFKIRETRKTPSFIQNKEKRTLEQVSNDCKTALNHFAMSLEENETRFAPQVYKQIFDEIVKPLEELRKFRSEDRDVKIGFIDLYKALRIKFGRNEATYKKFGLVFDTQVNLGSFEDKGVFNFHPNSSRSHQ